MKGVTHSDSGPVWGLLMFAWALGQNLTSVYVACLNVSIKLKVGGDLKGGDQT